MNIFNRIVKNTFDFMFSFFGLIFFSPIILLAWVVSSIETRSNGFYFQRRVGKNGKIFMLVKIKTMNEDGSVKTTVTQQNDKRITKIGSFFRKTKIDELPQLLNVFFGQMSFVGPRPDVVGYADKLKGEDRIIITMRPGITGPASIKYQNEEVILSRYKNPEKFNDEVIWPDKVKINREYVKKWSFWKDMNYIYLTLVKHSE